MSKRMSVLLEEVLMSVQLIRQYISGVSKDEFFAATQTQDAVLRRIEIIGEVVKNLPQEWCDAHPDVPWRQIARMRDTLIHRYFSVDLEIVWQTVSTDIPNLEPQIAALLAVAREQEAGDTDVADT